MNSSIEALLDLQVIDKKRLTLKKAREQQNGQVDDADFTLFVQAYNILDCADPAMPASCPADLNNDGAVDDSDFIVFVVAYNALICP